jgi:PhnB protein
MEEVRLDAYVFFAGNCKEAMEFYKSIFGGELTIQTYGDIPGETADNMKDKVMHADLSGGPVRLMASDAQEKPLGTGKISLSLSGNGEEKLRRYFERLSEGGKATMPLETAPWGDTFGMLTDQYDIEWMVNIAAKK